MFISPLISISCIAYENLDLEVRKLNVNISNETKLKYTADEFINQDYKKMISFSNVDFSKYEVSILGIKKLSETSINLFIELKSKRTNKTIVKKTQIDGFKSKANLYDEQLIKEINNEINKLKPPHFNKDKNKTFVKDVDLSDFTFEGFDKEKYLLNLNLDKSKADKGILKLTVFLTLRSNPKIKSLAKTFEITEFKTNTNSEGKEYFKGLEPDEGLEKIPYPISENELKANHATPITVNYVADGDTFYDTKGNKYRFNGVDTPESFKKDPQTGHFNPTTGMQKEYATYAAKFTEYYALNGLLSTYSKYKFRPTQIYAVPQKTKNGQTNISDHYGRIVAIIYYRDEFGRYHCLNEKLVLEGKARKNYISLSKGSKYYTENKAYYNLLEKAQEKSKNLKKGIWSPLANYDEIYPWR